MNFYHEENHNQKKQKTKEEEINDILLEIEKDLTNFKLSIDKKDKTIKEYICLLKIAKKEYQKLYQKNRHLKQRLLQARKNYQKDKQIKRKYIVEQP